MIPLRDVNPLKRRAVTNYIIIGMCAAAFFYELSLGRQLESFLIEYGLVPVRYSRPDIAMHFTGREQVLPFFSSMFLHGGWMHLIGNMWVLHIFGDNVEGELGPVRYFFFYLCSGLIAALIHVLTNLGSHTPTIGASGAVAGVMGAYFVLYPRAKVLTFVPIVFFFYLVEVPAWVFLGFWLFLQFFNGAFALVVDSKDFAGIAWWAHVGGFVGGIVLLWLFRIGLPEDSKGLQR